jgi:hypothetical protein
MLPACVSRSGTDRGWEMGGILGHLVFCSALDKHHGLSKTNGCPRGCGSSQRRAGQVQCSSPVIHTPENSTHMRLCIIS